MFGDVLVKFPGIELPTVSDLVLNSDVHQFLAFDDCKSHRVATAQILRQSRCAANDFFVGFCLDLLLLPSG